MPRRRSKASPSSGLALAAWCLVLAVTGTAAFASWRAVAEEATGLGARLGTFGESLLWPGALIFFGIAAMVWMGWKISLD